MTEKRKPFFLRWGEGPAVVIKFVRKNVFDVFVGNSWSKWSRVEVSGGDLSLIGGSEMDQRTLNFVKGRIVK
jgi:hypothetical protein